MNIQSYRPLEDNVLIEVLQQDEKLDLRLILPASVVNEMNRGKSDKPYKGRVLEVGPGRVMPRGGIRPVEVEVGDIVIFDHFTGHDRVMHEGREVAVVKEHDIKVVL